MSLPATDPMKDRMKVELKNAELDKFSLGTKVRVTAEGTVVELRAPEKYMRCCDGKDEEEIIPPCMYIVVDSKKVAPTGDKQIDAIVDSDEMEEADSY